MCTQNANADSEQEQIPTFLRMEQWKWLPISRTLHIHSQTQCGTLIKHGELLRNIFMVSIMVGYNGKYVCAVRICICLCSVWMDIGMDVLLVLCKMNGVCNIVCKNAGSRAVLSLTRKMDIHVGALCCVYQCSMNTFCCCVCIDCVFYVCLLSLNCTSGVWCYIRPFQILCVMSVIHSTRTKTIKVTLDLRELDA